MQTGQLAGQPWESPSVGRGRLPPSGRRGYGVRTAGRQSRRAGTLRETEQEGTHRIRDVGGEAWTCVGVGAPPVRFSSI